MAGHGLERVLSSGHSPWGLLSPWEQAVAVLAWLMLAAAIWGGMLHHAFPHMVPHWHRKIIALS